MKISELYSRIFGLLVMVLLISSGPLLAQNSPRELRRAGRILDRLADEEKLFDGWQYMGNLAVDSVALDAENNKVSVFLTPAVTHLPVREVWIRHLKHQMKNIIGRRYRHYDLDLFCRERSLSSYVPLYYASTIDSSRMTKRDTFSSPVKRADRQTFSKGLQNRNIALWASHGYYYEAGLDRWEWQRARLFSTVEDIYPFTFMTNYLMPMLEDAGAYVFHARERDTRRHEVIVDNDGSTGNSEVLLENGSGEWGPVHDSGFARQDTLKAGDNPFQMGSYLKYEIGSDVSGRAVYIPDIPEAGEYAVYVSWAGHPSAMAEVPCYVRHSGGQTEFKLNQQMAYGTWIYLGTFYFNEGKDRDAGSVVIGPSDAENGVITVDAVRFGGGMGNVARRPSDEYVPRQRSLEDKDKAKEESGRLDSVKYSWKLSGVPRWMEAGRYYLQYAGMPDTLVYSLNDGKNDYNDDYQSRGEWVNYLMGAPNGPTRDPDVAGLNVPVDLAFAFHTDAGITPGDSVIGTLGIYSSERDDGVFPNGRSKLSSRDLTDMVQSQIVTDIRLNYDFDWTRRAIWDREYSEAYRPNVPTMLLELLSHQNLADMKYGLDPRFQFTVSRAIYKGMARFLAAAEGREVMIKPLPPENMAIQHIEDKRVRISWKPVADPAEPSADPTGYQVYRRTGDNGFDNGTYTTDTSLVVELPEYETLYSFKVEALNDGGRSLPGETLSVSLQPGVDDLVLIVNGFDRIGPPSFVDSEVSGIARWEDEGVPWHQNPGYTGRQYDFDRSSPWLSDDSPGHGASYADMEGKPVAGNTFDHVITHGKAIRNAGYSFVSVSDEVFENPGFSAEEYFAVDLLFGEERGTKSLTEPGQKDYRIWTPEMIDALSRYLEGGGNVLATGAYIGTDMIENEDSTAIVFAKEKMGYEWMSDRADNVGKVEVTDRASSIFLPTFTYNTEFNSDIYRVEAPDAIEPAGENAFRLFRYSTDRSSAGTAFSGKHKSVVLGFPFETVNSVKERNVLMKQVLSFFGTDE